MPEAHARRRARLRTQLPDVPADAALVTSLVNVRYLTGFVGSNAALLLTPERGILATDGRYETAARQSSPDVELVVERACAAALTRLAGRAGARRVAFEAHATTVEAYRALSALEGAPELVELGHQVETLRQSKDDTELAMLREACAISDRALTETIGGIAPGQTERDVARRLEACMLELGAEAVAFPTIVASGPNSAIPHHRPTGREIERGDLLKIDFGALYEGYHADCTRTFVVGAQPADWQREIYDVVRTAARAGRRALVPGAEVRDVDAAARTVVAAAGYGDFFPHGLGHGVGLEIHEAPFIGHASAGRVDARTALTVEPGIYLPDRGGVRIEDTLVVSEGQPELLTTTPKDLLVL